MIEDPELRRRLGALFPFLEDSVDDQRSDFFARASLARLPDGRMLAAPGDECGQLMLVVQGRLRIYRTTPEGREITLYRLTNGESCVLTAACIMSHEGFPAMAETVGEVEALLIPAADARRWLGCWPAWCTFIFRLVSQRLAEVIVLLEEVAFERMNVRIAHYLLALTEADAVLHTTHQRIADDLGTSREVVSRIVKAFESSGLIEVSRRTIVVRDRPHLEAIGSIRRQGHADSD